jgi:pre-mRNA-splicing factor ATP-dependent RNA helicase DHX16
LDSARKQAEREAKALRSHKFDFLLDDEAGREDVTELTEDKRKGEQKGSGKDKRHRPTRKREYDGKEWESDGEEKFRKRRREDNPEVDDNVDMELSEDEDIRRERERL